MASFGVLLMTNTAEDPDHVDAVRYCHHCREAVPQREWVLRAAHRNPKTNAFVPARVIHMGVARWYSEEAPDFCGYSERITGLAGEVLNEEP